MEFWIFICPRSQAFINSGIAMDAPTFRQTRNVTLSLDCPHCPTRHKMKIARGFTTDSPPQKDCVAV
jgi:hypothetical protein